jgi:hypothetical protein
LEETVTKKKRQKPGPKPVIVKIEGDWIDALKRVLHIKRPKKWPDVPGAMELDDECNGDDEKQET